MVFFQEMKMNPHNLPIPLSKMVEHLGYTVYSLNKQDAPPHFAGAVDYSRKAIFVNDADCYYRQRFTIAHEIAHIVLHKKPAFIDYRTEDEQGCNKESEANSFAAELLMPAEVFYEQWKINFGSLPILSKLFAVSEDAIYYRAKNLGLL